MKSHDQNKIRMLLFIVSILGVYKFYEISSAVSGGERSLASVEMSSATSEEIAENQLDLELLALQQRLGGTQIKKCYDNRLTCGGIRNHSKCLSDKVSLFMNCANLDKTQIAQIKEKISVPE